VSAQLTLGAAARSLRRLADGARGMTTRARIGRLAALAELDPHGRELNVGDVVVRLFPGNDSGVERFRELRSTLRKLATEQGVELACEVDGQKHAAAHQRRCWFEGADDEVERIEQLSLDASQSPPGTVEVKARARRAILRVCIDGPSTVLAKDLTERLTSALSVDRELDVELSDTRALAGERPGEVRDRRLAAADLVVCLLSHEYLREHGDSAAAAGAAVIPVAIEPLGRADLGSFESAFAHDGKSYEDCGRRGQFVNALHAQIAARVTRPAKEGPAWECLLPGDITPDVVDARALRATLDHRPATARAPDDTVDVQGHLQTWADDPAGRPYLVVFGEYGMGKTTACQVFTRALVERRRGGDGSGRLPIYLDLRNLGDAKRRAPTLEPILDHLLDRAWQSGLGARPTAREVIEHVQRQRAVVVFDGLDEVLVHLSEREGQALLRQLWSILPPQLHADDATRPRAGRVLMTCRTHFFRTLREQHTYFRGEDREAVGADAYAALHLLPFSEEQVRAYLEQREDRDPAGAGADRALEVIRAVHNLSELVARPYNLRLVADQLGALERRIASGERVDTAALYDELVASWLARDEGKHELRKDDKLRLMEELAAELWRAGRRSLPVERLESWLLLRLTTDDDLGCWFELQRPEVAVLAEDLRTATFIVRPGTDEFRFAHTSLLEYFLARRLARALAEGDAGAWELPQPSPETLDFLGEIVSARDTQACLRGLRALRGSYRPQASELAFAYCLRALERGAPTVPLAGFQLDGAQLRGVQVAGPPDGPPLSLAGSALAGADLREARFERVRLERCDLRGANLTRAELHDCVLERCQLDGADLTGAIVRDCRTRELDVRGVRAHRTQWLRCALDGARWPDADEGQLVAAPRGGTPPVRAPARERARLTTFTGHVGWVGAVVFSHGMRLASAGQDGTVRVWDAESGDELLRLTGHDDWVHAVAFSPDGARLASAGQDGTVRVWDAASGDELLRLTGHNDYVNAVAFSPDGTCLASAGQDGTVRVWDAASGDELLRLTGHDGGVHAVVFSHGMRLASAGQDGTVRVWDAASGDELLRLTGHDDWRQAVVFSPDGARLASAGDDGTVRIWDAASGDELLRLTDHNGAVHAVAYSPDGARLASAGDDGTVRVWDAASGDELLRLTGHNDYVNAVVFSPDGACLASVGDDGTVRVWDAASGDELLRLTGHDDWGQAVVFSPDGARLASAGKEGTVRVWDAASGDELLRLTDHNGAVHAVAYSPDGMRLASAGQDGTVRVWDAESGDELLRLTDHNGWIYAVACSPDGMRLASAGDDGTVRVWDAASGDELLRLTDHDGRVGAVVFSPDGACLASAGDDGTVRVWDAASGDELLRLTGHNGWVHAVACSPDGTRLVSASDDGTVRVWDAASGDELLRLTDHNGRVRAVACSPDGTRLASVGQDASVRIWDAATGDELLAIHGFAPNERAVFTNGALTSCTPGAWRWLGWLAPAPETGRLTRYPAETFGPLPINA
jgi:WD40 repeat protein